MALQKAVPAQASAQHPNRCERSTVTEDYPSTATRSVLSVGNCSYDHGNIESLIRANFDARVTPAASADEAIAMLAADRYDLVLINRILLDDRSEGVRLVERIKADPRMADVSVMLLSNYPDAQAAAVAAGAEPGFGKAELGRPETVEKLGRFLR